MASYKEHCAECEEKLGNAWYVVHRWLDEHFARMGYDVRHRDIRHHSLGIEEVRKMWGDEAAQAARIHIEMDFMGYVPKNDDDVMKWRLGVVHTPPGTEWKDGILVPKK